MRVLDLFCGEGGAARGYIAAGFDVIGVDTRRSVGRYYPGEVWFGDWRERADELRALYVFDLIHASPPCQHYSQGTVALDKDYPDLVGEVREYLLARGLPFVIENVERAPLVDPVTLCGTMFDLQTPDPDDHEMLYLRRHRLFEAHGFDLFPDETWCACVLRDECGWRCAGVYGGGRTDKYEARNVRHGGYTPKSKATRAALMGVSPDDFTLHGLSQAIPPAYSEWVGRQFLSQMRKAA